LQPIEKIIPGEQLNLDKLSESHDFQMAAQIVQAVGAVLGLIPDFKLGAHGFGGSPAVDASFGEHFLPMLQAPLPACLIFLPVQLAMKQPGIYSCRI
jgi:hypothetical protein